MFDQKCIFASLFIQFNEVCFGPFKSWKINLEIKSIICLLHWRTITKVSKFSRSFPGQLFSLLHTESIIVYGGTLNHLRKVDTNHGQKMWAKRSPKFPKSWAWHFHCVGSLFFVGRRKGGSIMSSGRENLYWANFLCLTLSKVVFDNPGKWLELRLELCQSEIGNMIKRTPNILTIWRQIQSNSTFKTMTKKGCCL